MNSMTQMSDTMASWLNLDDIYIPTFLDEFPDFTMQNDQLLNFPTSNDQNNPLSLNLQPNYTNELSFLFGEFETDTDMLDPVQPQTYMSVGSMSETALISTDGNGSDQCVNCDAWLVEPAESYESVEEPVSGSVVSVDTPDMFVSSAEKGSVVSRNYENGDEVDESDEERKAITSSCKNLVSERNRRKRIGQQLRALRALVPNITKVTNYICICIVMKRILFFLGKLIIKRIHCLRFQTKWIGVRLGRP